jgi:L-ascorbate metabolism protein UlaG (beta-lactamase superfamily)
MSEKRQLYLRPNIQLEPLVDRWYAWAHLIAPSTAARNITGRHMKIMESYINSPQSHAAAVRNPKLLGGPFMDFDGDRSADIRALLEETRSRRVRQIAFSRAIDELDELLRAQANGFALEPLYQYIPDLLQGYVELVYDLNNHPAFRIFEALLYKSPFYDKSMQSLMLSVISQDDRPFVLSTPRLEGQQTVHCQVSFDHEGVDRLFKMKTQPTACGEIEEILGIPADQRPVFESFLTAEAPPPYSPYLGKGARWRYFGHACVLLETCNTSILLDPVLSYTYDSKISRYTYQDLPDKIDFVLITHNHQDHILFETLLQIRHRIGTIVVPRGGGGALHDPSLKMILENCGFRNVVELSDLEELKFPAGSIRGIPFLGEHGDLDVRTKLAYLVKVNGHSLMFAADSRNISPKMYQHVNDLVGDVEVLFLGMECDGAPMSWIYGPLLTQKLERNMDHSRRLAGSNFSQAIEIVNQFRCREVYVYAMGQEPWLNYVMSIKYTEQSNPIIESNKLIEACQKRGIVAERLFGEKEILLS